MSDNKIAPQIPTKPANLISTPIEKPVFGPKNLLDTLGAPLNPEDTYQLPSSVKPLGEVVSDSASVAPAKPESIKDNASTKSVTTTTAQSTKAAASNAVAGIKAGIAQGLNSVKNAGNTAAKKIGNVVKKVTALIRAIVKASISAVANAPAKLFKGPTADVVDYSDALNRMFDGLTDDATDMGDELQNLFSEKAQANKYATVLDSIPAKTNLPKVKVPSVSLPKLPSFGSSKNAALGVVTEVGDDASETSSIANGPIVTVLEDDVSVDGSFTTASTSLEDVK